MKIQQITPARSQAENKSESDIEAAAAARSSPPPLPTTQPPPLEEEYEEIEYSSSHKASKAIFSIKFGRNF